MISMVGGYRKGHFSPLELSDDRILLKTIAIKKKYWYKKKVDMKFDSPL